MIERMLEEMIESNLAFCLYHYVLDKRVKAMLHTLVTRVMRVFNIRDKSGYFEMESSMKIEE